MLRLFETEMKYDSYWTVDWVGNINIEIGRTILQKENFDVSAQLRVKSDLNFVSDSVGI
jgi:hypothetical protein